MNLADTGLHKQPFGIQGKPLILVPYAAHRNALHFLDEIRSNKRGLGLFHGPPLSGKTTIIQKFVSTLPGDHTVAIINGAHTGPARLLKDILSQFGYEHGFDTPSERFNMIRVVALQQASRGFAPVLVIENVHQMSPVLLEMLCELSEISVDGTSALRIILVTDRSRLSVFDATALQSVESRLTGKFLLKPLTRTETATYAHKKLRSGGCHDPKTIMPAIVCERLHSASGGWPGVIDRMAMMALARAKHLPLQVEHIPMMQRKNRKQPNVVEPEPRLILTCEGKTLKQISVDKPRLLIGRNALCDIDIVHEWISRQHAVLIRKNKSTVIVDLKSRNGVYVNGKRVKHHVLINNDIISLGDHRLKYVDPTATQRTSLRDAGWDDTTLAESMRDFRKGLLRQLKQY
jgi:type II secretory pathway predicted ATPase ExeA